MKYYVYNLTGRIISGSSNQARMQVLVDSDLVNLALIQSLAIKVDKYWVDLTGTPFIRLKTGSDVDSVYDGEETDKANRAIQALTDINDNTLNGPGVPGILKNFMLVMKDRGYL